MNDPHVVALVYRIEHSESIGYAKAAPFCRDEQGFRLSIVDGKARFEIHDHFPSIEAADEALTEYRRAWEFDAQLRRGPDTFHLVLERENSVIIDRNPTPGHVRLKGIGVTVVLGSAKLLVEPSVYPEPPSDIALTPDVETIYDRYMGYRRGREPLASMASFCLTVLEAATGERKGRRAAASKIYSIDSRVLSKIGELSANRGGAEARKVDGVATDFSSQERHFLERAVKVVIRRMAEREHSSGKSLSIISLADLPSLDKPRDVDPAAEK